MKDLIIKSISVIFHPLIMPTLGVVFYFSKVPRYINSFEAFKTVIKPVFLLTIVLPIIIFYLLKLLGKVKSIHLNTTKERILPLIVNCIIIILILLNILQPTDFIELYYFFVGILVSTFSCLILAFLRFKASIHMIAISGILMFFIALSIHFSINITRSLALISCITGAVATSRLYLKAHTFNEIIIGFFIGLLPQLILIPHWF